MKDKIDTSTYKEITKAKKQKERNKNVGKYAKGTYGHSKKYRIYRLIFAAILLVLILADVLFSVLVFHTRKTVYIIIACILAIPFARNVVDVIMTFKARPLSKEEYEKELKFKPHKYGEIYKELGKMEEGQCAKKECDNAQKARTIVCSIKRTIERNSDDRFEITQRGKCVYITRVK